MLPWDQIEPFWLVGAGVAGLVLAQTTLIINLYKTNHKLSRRVEKLKRLIKKRLAANKTHALRKV